MAIIDEVGFKRKLKIMLGSEELAEAYIQKFGYTIDMMKIKALRARAEEVQAGGVPEDVGSVTDPIFEVYVRCPACYMTNIPVWELRARSLNIVLDRFQMPHYLGTTEYKALDYTQYAVSVCPQCLFASPDKKDFLCRDPAKNREIPPRLHQGELAAILAAADDRATLLKEMEIDPAAEFMFNRKRTVKGGLAAYKLAIARAQIEFQRNVPFSAFKMGGYSLRQATLARNNQIDEEPYLREALAFYVRSYEASNAQGLQYEGLTLYEIIALSLRLGLVDQAGSYRGVIDKLRAERIVLRNDPAVMAQFMRYYTQACDLWTDRDDPSIWSSQDNGLLRKARRN